MNKFNVGDKVKAIDEETREAMPEYYPVVGVVGVVREVNELDYGVEWPKGTVTERPEGGTIWYCGPEDLELVESAKPIFMSYDEIWEMLKPKMEKNGLVGHCYGIYRDLACLYNPKDFQKAVALAYKMGYERAMKGRPFKYGEKKVKKVESHWEKVDLNNLPKNGTKVRFARDSEQNHLRWSGMKIGDTGVVEIDGRSFGVKPDHFEYGKYSWVSFNADSADSLDYWVEGDDAD